VKGILLRKPNKLDYIINKNYRIICLLNCIGKVVEKVVIEIITKLCERLELLYNGQFESRKLRGAINTIIKFIATIE
jgi:hypothetical protein